jgi:Mn-dependent DtxR family transcriptional regulator
VLAGCGPITQSRLAAELSLSARSITQAVEALERDGLVRRELDDTDRRATVVNDDDARHLSTMSRVITLRRMGDSNPRGR